MALLRRLRTCGLLNLHLQHSFPWSPHVNLRVPRAGRCTTGELQATIMVARDLSLPGARGHSDLAGSGTLLETQLRTGVESLMAEHIRQTILANKPAQESF
jgi:hypothetical protein